MRQATIGLTASQRRRELGLDIVHAAYLRGDFVLNAGTHSSYYFDKYLFVTRPAILRRVAAFLGEMIPPNADRLAGPGPGGVALASAVGLEIGIPFVITNDTPEQNISITGELHGGDRVVLVEDVLASGSRALAAIQALVRHGAEVLLVLAVVDRQEGAVERIGSAGYVARSLFNSSDLGIKPGS